MATERKIVIDTEIKGTDKLKDVIKDIKIAGISAEDMAKKMAEDAPNAISKVEKSLEGLNIKTLKQTKEEKKSLERKRKNMSAAEDMFKSYYSHNKEMAQRIAELSSASSKVAITMEQIQGLNEEAYKTLDKTTTAKLAASQKEIDELTKNAKSVEQVIKAYEKKKDILVEQSNIARASIKAEYEVAVKAGGDVVALKKLEKEHITTIDAKLKEDLKQNTKAYQSSIKELNNKHLTDLTSNIEVETKKVSRANKKIINNAASDAAKALGISEGAIKSVTDAAIKAAGESKKTETAAKTTEDAAKKTEDAAKKTAEATAKSIDIRASQENVKVAVAGLKHYKTTLEEIGRAAIKLYDEEIANAGENTEKRKKLEAEKVEAIKYYGERLIATSQAITATQKKDLELECKELEQYANNVKSVATSISDYFGSAFGAISNAYKADIASIDEDITHLKNKNAEITQEAESHAKQIAAIDAEQKNADAAGLTEKSESLKAKLKTEKAAYQESLEAKNKIEAKERELQKKKAKTQADQEKIEKLNRKVTLVKNIGEATANVAQGITKAWSYGPILGTILSAVVATAGAIQIGIMTKQLSKLENGGLLRGKRHTQGGMRIEGTNIEVEGGEYVVNRESTKKNLGLVRYINSQRKELTSGDIHSYFTKADRGYEAPFSRMFQTGGELPAIEVEKDSDNRMLIEAIKAIRIEPKVAVTDIHRVQDEMVNVDGWSGV